MYSNIVVGTDGSATAAAAVHHALHLAATVRARLHLVTAFTRIPVLAMAQASVAPGALAVVDDGAWIEPLHARFAEAADRVGVQVERHVIEGHPATVLIEVARAVRADLLVTGNRGMSGVRGLLGSVPKSLAHYAPCAVLVVPTHGL